VVITSVKVIAGRQIGKQGTPMDYSEKVECVRAGLDYDPTEQEVRYWLYGRKGEPQTEEQQAAFVESQLKGSPNDWKVKTFHLIHKIPRGYLITYGDLAKWVNKEYGLKIISQNTARLRGEIYDLIQHDTDIPIHRIAKKGDTESSYDHKVTQQFNRRKRGDEGTLRNPKWYVP
jgi:alkylated DNA nucleotide flippase Atl1